MKILKISANGGIGGGERVMLDIAKELKEEFDIFVMAPAGDFVHRSESSKIRTFVFYGGGFNRIKQIRDFLKNKEIDILHCHGTRIAIFGRLAVIGLKNKPKVIYTVHGFHIAKRNFIVKNIFFLLEKILNMWTDKVVCVSYGDERIVKLSNTINQNNITVIYNGIYIEKFNIFSRDTDNDNVLKLIAVARLHEPKDYKTLFQAVKILKKNNKKVALQVIGDGPLKEELVDFCEKLGLNDCIDFLGARNDVPDLMQWSDVVVLSTKWEGLPLVPIEAGASRKPVVASNVSGVDEVVKNGETGFLFEPGNAEDLAECIIKLQDKKLRKKMGEAGYSRVKKMFSVERMCEEYKQLYLEITK